MIINNRETNATQFAYDGCHKMYIIEDAEDLKEAEEMGYEILAIDTLEDTFNRSCPLRFIDNWKLTKTFIEQGQTDNSFEYDEDFWCKPNWRTILKQSIKIDYENGEHLLNYDDDTELFGYHKDGDRYDIWLAVFDGYLVWTLNDYAENIACEIWNTEVELGDKPFDFLSDAQNMKIICQEKLKEMIVKYGHTN